MDIPVVRIEAPDGKGWNANVTVDGVMIPCTRVTWTCNAGGLNPPDDDA